MKKRLYKIIAISIGISVISGAMVPAAFAVDVIQKINDTKASKISTTKVLTLDDAIKSAINTSEILSLDEKKISYMDKTNDVNEQIDDNPQLVYKTEVDTPDNRKDLNEDTRDIKLKQCTQQRDFDEDKLTHQVTTIYNDIVIDQIQIDKLKKDIELKNNDMSIIKVKNDVGMATTVDVDSNSIALETQQDKLKSSESNLKSEQYKFKVLTGEDLSLYSLDQNVKLNKFTIDGSVDEYLDNAVENYLKYSTQIVELNKDYFNDSDNKVDDVSESDKPSDTKPTISSDADLAAYEQYATKLDGYYQERYMYAYRLSLRLAYLNGKIGTYESETNLDETKKQFKEQLRDFYAMLTTTEDNITLLKKNIALNNKQLSIAKIKYDDQLMTKIDYDHLISNSKDLDIQLRSAMVRYNTLKDEIEKPWVAFSK